VELIPSKAAYGPDEPVVIELAGAASSTALPAGGTLVVTRLLDEVARIAVATDATSVALPGLGLGGFGVALELGGRIVARTAFDVLGDPFERPRYGFVAQLDGHADSAADAAFFRRMHLNLAQFYDWGWKHSELLPPEREYLDPLGQPRDLAVVNAVAEAFDAAGVVPLGYSAVYAVGNAEVEAWQDELLVRADGVPYRLGDDFLTLVDPAGPRWLAHYREMLSQALEGTSLRGFHLDQYGWPKRALRGDGARVDLAASYATMIAAVREAVPAARLIFNNVNDFGTAQTAGEAQDGSYIEVWPPHSTYADLGALALRTRALRPDHPPILSAYLSCYSREPAERADAAARLAMATVFSHGATHLLLGEQGRVLTDPYYPRNHALSPASVTMFAEWYDMLVRWGDLLTAPGQTDVTEFMTGGINTDLVFISDHGVRFSTRPEPGTVWTRVVRTARGLVVHLINLTAQSEITWDAGKSPASVVAGISLRFAPVDGDEVLHWIEPGADPRPLTADPADEVVATDALSASQSMLEYRLPELGDWAVLFLPDPDAEGDVHVR